MSNINFQGAVDLAGLARTNTPKPTAPAESNPHVIDVTMATFDAQVLQQSMTVPVVLDFWATWCQPCTQLSPVLEKLASEYAGRFILAKIDVDAEQAIAQAFQVSSIPAVFAVFQGQPVPLFQGAMPEHQVRGLIDQLLAAAAKAGAPGAVPDGEPAPAPADPRFDAAEAAIEAGDWDAASEAYKLILKSAPADAVAKVALLNVELMRRNDGVDLAEVLDRPGDDIETHLAKADAEFLMNRYPEAFARLVDLVSATRDKERALVQERLIQLFDIAGPHDPAVAQARTALANALF